MGSYISGEKLHEYKKYFVDSAMDKGHNNIPELDDLRETTKRMGPATHVGLNRALLDFSNRLVPYLTEKRFCGRVIYSGGDDVMAVLPLEDLPEYILSLRSAWCGAEDPAQEPEFSTSRDGNSTNSTGYWHPQGDVEGLPQRPLFTMGAGATISMGVVIAHKSVPLPTVLESLWVAEKTQAKKMGDIDDKDGICFRVIYGGGNQSQALMKGKLLQKWWDWVKEYEDYGADLSPLLYRLAEELPQRASVSPTNRLFSQAAKVIMTRRNSDKQLDVFPKIAAWLDDWEDWVHEREEKASLLGATSEDLKKLLGTKPEDLGQLLRFTAFWVDKRVERYNWGKL
jgi:CRISPR-associated protein Cmr2